MEAYGHKFVFSVIGVLAFDYSETYITDRRDFCVCADVCGCETETPALLLEK
jgi:hypothetical protein